MKDFWDYPLDNIYNFVVALFVDIFELLKDLVFWIYEQILDVSAWGVSLVEDGLPTINLTGYWASAPQELIQILAYVHFNQCIDLVVSAIGIRFVMNFIPFIK